MQRLNPSIYPDESGYWIWDTIQSPIFPGISPQLHVTITKVSILQDSTITSGNTSEPLGYMEMELHAANAASMQLLFQLLRFSCNFAAKQS